MRDGTRNPPRRPEAAALSGALAHEHTRPADRAARGMERIAHFFSFLVSGFARGPGLPTPKKKKTSSAERSGIFPGRVFFPARKMQSGANTFSELLNWVVPAAWCWCFRRPEGDSVVRPEGGCCVGSADSRQLARSELAGAVEPTGSIGAGRRGRANRLDRASSAVALDASGEARCGPQGRRHAFGGRGDAHGGLSAVFCPPPPALPLLCPCRPGARGEGGSPGVSARGGEAAGLGVVLVLLFSCFSRFLSRLGGGLAARHQKETRWERVASLPSCFAFSPDVVGVAFFWLASFLRLLLGVRDSHGSGGAATVGVGVVCASGSSPRPSRARRCLLLSG